VSTGSRSGTRCNLAKTDQGASGGICVVSARTNKRHHHHQVLYGRNLLLHTELADVKQVIECLRMQSQAVVEQDPHTTNASGTIS
jgi:hypothetical protein